MNEVKTDSEIVNIDSMIVDMSFRELRSLKQSLGIKGKGNTKASLKRSIKAFCLFEKEG